tara:strand:+ start:324 stop:533 length:210 start_codon:yes stop_codon:yes gene_type:complete
VGGEVSILGALSFIAVYNEKILVRTTSKINDEISITDKIVIFGFRANIEFLELADLVLAVIILPYEILV